MMMGIQLDTQVNGLDKMIDESDYILCFVALTMILGLFGLDFQTALSGAATSISNVGPGLGDVIGPAGDFSNLPAGAKWAMCLGMLLGRLELFTVLVMLSPRFWGR